MAAAIVFPDDPSDAKAWSNWAVPESASTEFFVKFKSVPNYKKTQKKANVESNAAETAFRLAVQRKYDDTSMVVFDWMVKFSQSIWNGAPLRKPTTEHSKVAAIGFRIALRTLLLSGWKFELE